MVFSHLLINLFSSMFALTGYLYSVEYGEGEIPLNYIFFLNLWNNLRLLMFEKFVSLWTRRHFIVNFFKLAETFYPYDNAES